MKAPSPSSSPPPSFSWLFLLLLPTILLQSSLLSAGLTPSSSNYMPHFCNNINGNYTNSSSYHSGLDTLQSLLASSSSTIQFQPNRSFYNLSTGPVDALGFCRRDIPPPNCRSCLANAVVATRKVCPTQKEAIGWLSSCMVRYSDRTVAINSSLFAFNYSDPNHVASPEATYLPFGMMMVSLLPKLKAIVSGAADSQEGRFAGGMEKVDSSRSVYVFVECTPGLRQAECARCIQELIDYIPECCTGTMMNPGGFIVAPSCGLRYDVYKFYSSVPAVVIDDSPSRSTSPPNAILGTSKQKRKTRKHLMVISLLVATLIVVATVLMLGIWIWLRRKMFNKTFNAQEIIKEMRELESLQFEFSKIKIATRNFSDENKLGQGGFGEVYKGKLENGQEIAVKRLSDSSGQGVKEFKTEAILVAKLQHKNLVRLLGFCLSLKEKLLIYEFLPNSSLDRLLFDTIKKVALNWETRLKVIVGIARGLMYLHEDSRLKIIHRDLKTSNILLDESMNPKISDFGLAKLISMDQTQGDTNRIVGTYGYMAPEYAVTGHFSDKSDVFSFGIIVLEIVSGQKNRYFAWEQDDEEGLLYRAWRFWNEDKALTLVDPSLDDKYEPEELMKCIHIGLLCIQEDPTDRPRMASIVSALSGDSVCFPTPKPPQFFGKARAIAGKFLHNNMSSSTSQRTGSFTGTTNITQLFPR